MKINFYVGTLINKGYCRLYSQSDGNNIVCLEIDDKYTWNIFPWLNSKYENEKIDYRNLFLAGKCVLIVSLDVNLSEEIYFEIGGALYNKYKNNLLEELLYDFSIDINKNENSALK